MPSHAIVKPAVAVRRCGRGPRCGPVELPVLGRNVRALDATVRRPGRALHGAGDHHLADIDALALQPRRQQADQLVLGGVGQRQAHGLHAHRELVHRRRELAVGAVGDEDGAVARGLEVRQRLLDGGEQAHHRNIEERPRRRRVGGQQVARLAAAVGVPVQHADRAQRRARLADGTADGGRIAGVGRERGRLDASSPSAPRPRPPAAPRCAPPAPRRSPRPRTRRRPRWRSPARSLDDDDGLGHGLPPPPPPWRAPAACPSPSLASDSPPAKGRRVAVSPSAPR